MSTSEGCGKVLAEGVQSLAEKEHSSGLREVLVCTEEKPPFGLVLRGIEKGKGEP
jgi:hypothetical protein